MTPLSKRLDMIASMVSPGTVAADIGTDHGFVPMFLVSRGIVEKAIACDVRKGPLERALTHIAEEGLADRIGCRLGDGLECLKPGEADRVIIAGMGGELVIRILAASPETFHALPELVLSPHTDVPKVRRFLAEQGFSITDEAMTEEDGKFYTAIRAENTAMTSEGKTEAPATYSEEELLFGPVLLEKRPPVFLGWLEKEERKTALNLKKLQRARDTEKNAVQRKEKETYLFRIRAVISTKRGGMIKKTQVVKSSTRTLKV